MEISNGYLGKQPPNEVFQIWKWWDWIRNFKGYKCDRTWGRFQMIRKWMSTCWRFSLSGFILLTLTNVWKINWERINMSYVKSLTLKNTVIKFCKKSDLMVTSVEMKFYPIPILETVMIMKWCQDHRDFQNQTSLKYIWNLNIFLVYHMLKIALSLPKIWVSVFMSWRMRFGNETNLYLEKVRLYLFEKWKKWW